MKINSQTNIDDQLLLSSGLNTFMRSDSLRHQPHKPIERVEISSTTPVYDDFGADLDIASKSALSLYGKLLERTRMTDKLMSALDGLTPDNRSSRVQIEFLKIIESLLDDDTGLKFEPAINVLDQGSSSIPVLEHSCACGIDQNGSRVFLSKDLGFRDLCEYCEAGVSASLAIRAQNMGLSLDISKAAERIVGLVRGREDNSGTVMLGENGWVRTETGRTAVHVIAYHNSTY